MTFYNPMKRNFILQIEDTVREDLQAVAQGGHMDDTKYAAVWMKELSTLKPEFALKVLGLIPPEWKHRRPGRPTKSPESNSVQEAVKEVA